MKTGVVVNYVHKYCDSLCRDISECLIKYFGFSLLNRDSKVSNYIFSQKLKDNACCAFLLCKFVGTPLFKSLASCRSPNKIKERHHTYM